MPFLQDLEAVRTYGQVMQFITFISQESGQDWHFQTINHIGHRGIRPRRKVSQSRKKPGYFCSALWYKSAMSNVKRFLFVSIDALISDIAWCVHREGNEVRYYIESETERQIADGFVPKVDDWAT